MAGPIVAAGRFRAYAAFFMQQVDLDSQVRHGPARLAAPLRRRGTP